MAQRILVERMLTNAGVDRSAPVSRRGRSVQVNLAESPLGWLKSRGHVDDRQFDAGEQLRADYERSQLAPSVTMRWDASPVGRGAGAEGRLDQTQAQIAARRRFDAAIAAVGAGLSDIVWRVVCAGEGMRDAEQALGWPARSGKLVLGMALDRLAGHYGMR